MKQHSLFKSLLACSVFLVASEMHAQKINRVSEDVSDLLISMFDVSPNGKFSCGYQTMQCYSASYDMEADTSFIYTKYSDENAVFNMVWGVSDDGTVVGQYGADWGGELTRIFYAKGNVWTDLDVPAGVLPNGSARCISADGSVIGGWAPLDGVRSDFDSDVLCPLVWFKGADKYEVHQLPYPEYDWFGLKTTRAMVEQMSDDGRVLVGRLTDNSGVGNQLIVWTRGEDNVYSYKLYGEEYTYKADAEKPGELPVESDYIHSEPGTPEYEKEVEEYNKVMEEWLVKRNACFANTVLDELAIYVSGNGKYLTASYKVFDTGEQIPFYINLESGEIIEITQADNAAPRGITDDGLLVYVAPAVGYARQTYVCTSNNDIRTVQDWCKEDYGLDLESFLAEKSLEVSGTGCADSKGTTMTFYQPDPEKPGYGFDYYIKLNAGGSSVISTACNSVTAYVENKMLNINTEGCDVSVFDMAGSCLCKWNNAAKVLDLSELPEGFYVMKITKGQNELLLKSLVR